MKKIILGLALIFSISTVAIAQEVQGNTGATEQMVQGKDKKDKKDRKAKKGNFEKANPFEGIDLSESQKVQLKELNNSMKSVKENEKRENGKQNFSDDQKKEMNKQRMIRQQANKKKYLEGVKKILSPEQYVQFLENCYLMQGNTQNIRKPMRGQKSQK